MDQAAPSAGDHQYRELRLTIWPTAAGGRYAVQVRLRRGAALLWDRRICTDDVAAAADEHVGTQAGVLRAVAAACIRAADRMEGS